MKKIILILIVSINFLLANSSFDPLGDGRNLVKNNLSNQVLKARKNNTPFRLSSFVKQPIYRLQLDSELVKKYTVRNANEPSVVKRTSDIYCHQLNMESEEIKKFNANLEKNKDITSYSFDTFVSHVDFDQNDSLRVECTTTLTIAEKDYAPHSEVLFTYILHKNVDYTTADYQASTYVQNELKSDPTQFENRLGLMEHSSIDTSTTLTHYITGAFSSNSSIFDYEKFNQYALYFSKKDNISEEEKEHINLLNQSGLGILHHFVNSNISTNFFYVVTLIISISLLVLLYKLLLYIVNRFVKDKENRDDEEVKINFILFIPSILVIFIFFMPYKNVDNTYRNNAQKIISSFGSALQVVADKMTYSLTESVLLNLKNRGGLVDYFEANENAKRYFRLKFQQIFFKDLYETVNSHYLNSENYAKMEYYNNKSYAYSSGDFIADIYGYAGSQVSDDYYFAKNFNFSYYGVCNTWGGAYPGLGNESNFNAKNYKINKELQALDRWFDTLEKNSTVNAEKSELLNKIITHAVDQSEKDGFLSLITTVPNVFILSNLILNNDEQIEKMKEKIEEALDAGTPAESMARVMTENIAYLTAPGAELIMNSIKGLGNAIPGAGLFTTPIAVATAIIYGQNFYELLYIFVYIFIISISLLLWWVGISLYIIISYFIPAFVFFKDNANIVSTFTKTVAVHLFKIPIVVISSVIGFSVMSLMITLINYQSFSLNTMQNSIQESSFNIGSSLIVGLMSVLAYLLISGLIYWLITKGTKVFTEAISKQFSDSDDAMQIVENRIKSKM